MANSQAVPNGTWAQVRHAQTGRLIAVAALTVLVTAAALTMPIVVARLIGGLLADRSSWLLIGALLGLAAVSAVGSAAHAGLVAQVAERFTCTLRTRLVTRSLSLPTRGVQSLGIGDLTSRLTGDTMQLRAALDIALGQLPQAGLMVVGTVAVMAWLDPVLLAVTVASFCLAALVITWLYRGLQSAAMRHQTHLGELSQRYGSALTALPTVKSLRAEPHVINQLHDAAVQAEGSGVAYA